MQEGAPPHFAIPVRTRLDKHFPGRWIGRRGLTEWPPRSHRHIQCNLLLKCIIKISRTQLIVVYD
jgi:hypothetical protein